MSEVCYGAQPIKALSLPPLIKLWQLGNWPRVEQRYIKCILSPTTFVLSSLATCGLKSPAFYHLQHIKHAHIWVTELNLNKGWWWWQTKFVCLRRPSKVSHAVVHCCQEGWIWLELFRGYSALQFYCQAIANRHLDDKVVFGTSLILLFLLCRLHSKASEALKACPHLRRHSLRKTRLDSVHPLAGTSR